MGLDMRFLNCSSLLQNEEFVYDEFISYRWLILKWKWHETAEPGFSSVFAEWKQVTDFWYIFDETACSIAETASGTNDTDQPCTSKFIIRAFMIWFELRTPDGHLFPISNLVHRSTPISPMNFTGIQCSRKLRKPNNIPFLLCRL